MHDFITVDREVKRLWRANFRLWALERAEFTRPRNQ